MENFYSAERNVQMLIYLMKMHGVKKVVVSPGATNVTVVASLQQDSWFEMYSAVDERSAAYMACGLAAESGEAVALSCTGATASRNYVPGLTEAFYRKLPILAITSTQDTGRIGQLAPQVIDRSNIQNDIAVFSADIPTIHDAEDEWACNVKINTALLALKYRGGGPVHINLTTTYCRDFSVRELPESRVIRRITINEKFPEIKKSRVGIFVGSHKVWTERLTNAVEKFCEKYNAAVLCDHTSNYHGKYRVQYNLVESQYRHAEATREMELLIDMGEVSGAYMWLNPSKVWRVNPDGQIRDRFKKLEYLFDMNEEDFFERYVEMGSENLFNISYYNKCKEAYDYILERIPELPFSNIWIAQNMSKILPENSVLHLGILNSLRSWNFFEISPTISCYCNTGGFGIDGIVSTLVGSSLANKYKLHFCIIGDLAFFYDLNAIGNHNVGNNIRILLINNGCGTEFKNYNHFAAKFGNDADDYMAARGHYGKQSSELVKHYAMDLGFEYFSAKNKEEYLKIVERFVSQEIGDKPILFEVFTNSNEESDALNKINHVVEDPLSSKEKAKQIAKDILGEKRISTLKKLVKG